MRRNLVDFTSSDTIQKTFVADADKTLTCANGVVTVSWDGYTADGPIILDEDYVLTYAPIAPSSVRVGYRSGYKFNLYDYNKVTYLNKSGKAVGKKVNPNSPKVKSWRAPFTTWDWPNKPLTVQKRTVKKVNGKWVRGKWKKYRTIRTNAKSVAQIVLPGGGRAMGTVRVTEPDQAIYRVVVPGSKGWNTNYAYLDGNRSIWH